MKRQGIAEALRDGIAEEMQRDPAVFCLGEDIAIPGGWGGAFTVTLGLEKQFPDRMINTPIAELGFFGVATGAALMGMRPIVDVQYGDFLLLASDQIINNAAKLRYMSGGTCQIPMVMRAPIGATGRGSQHAQSLERYFIGVPGLKVVAVSTAYDAKGILKAAVRDGNPVMIFEHKLLYGSKGARAEPGAVDATSEGAGCSLSGLTTQTTIQGIAHRVSLHLHGQVALHLPTAAFTLLGGVRRWLQKFRMKTAV